jgi:hypothetical protein
MMISFQPRIEFSVQRAPRGRGTGDHRQKDQEPIFALQCATITNPIQDHPAEPSSLAKTMIFTAAERAAVAAAYDFSQFETIIDVGRATGNLLTAILGRHRGPRGIFFDPRHVVCDAPALIDASAKKQSESSPPSTTVPLTTDQRRSREAGPLLVRRNPPHAPQMASAVIKLAIRTSGHLLFQRSFPQGWSEDLERNRAIETTPVGLPLVGFHRRFSTISASNGIEE